MQPIFFLLRRELSSSLVQRAGKFAWLLLLAAMSSLAAQVSLPQLWQNDLQTFLESSGTIASLDGTARQAAIIAGREEIITLDGQGKVLWRWRTKGRFMTYPAVLVRAGQPSLIYAADNAGVFTCLDGTGKEIWHAQLKGPSSWSASVICDLLNDGQFEVIQTDETGTVAAFQALNGKLIWETKLKGMPVSPAVGDLDGDGKPEIVVATGEGLVTALSGSGAVLWERKLGGSSQSWATSAPVIFAGSDGRARVVAASSDGQFYCLDSRGEILWQRPTRGAVASTISVGDLDLDGRADICLITQVGVIHRFDENGRAIWEIDMQGRSLAPGAIIDIDGDGKPEYVLCTQDGFLQVLNEPGEFLYRYHFKNRTINVTPTFGKLIPDRKGLEVLVTGGESGIAFCLGSTAATDALAQWTCYRADTHNSGSWFGLKQAKTVQMIPANLAAAEILAGQSLRFLIKNPSPGKQPLTATAVCVRPDGARQMSSTSVLGKEGELLLPLEVMAPGNYHFKWSLLNGVGTALALGERSLFLQPFVNETALANRALTALNGAATRIEATLPLSAVALRRESTALETELTNLLPAQQAISGAEPGPAENTWQRTAALVTRSKRLIGIAGIMPPAAALGPGTSLIPFSGTLWENRQVDQQLPVRAENPLRLKRTAVAGEHEPVALGLFNVTDHELLVRVSVEPLTNGIIVTLHRSVGVPTSLGEVAWDPLPELDETGTLTVPSLSSRELWVDIKLGDVKPGHHVVKLRLQSLNGAGVLDGPPHPHTVPPPENEVEIAVHVPAFAMVPSGQFRLCTWATPDEALLPDLLEHGNNVFTTGLPGINYDEQGKLTGSDYGRLDPILRRLHGQDVVLLLQGIPNLHGELGSALYREDLKSFLNDLVAHMNEAGFDTNHFALYPFDEPGGIGWSVVNQLVEFGKLVRAIKPGVMLYVDGGGELPMFEAMSSCIDIWCPSIYMLAEKTPLMDVVRSHGKMLWSYNCGYAYSRPVGPNLKNMNLIGDYRAAAPFAFRHGGTGIGYWCYNLGGDPWGRIDMEYMLVYPGRHGPITSRRWEAVREGIEDYRILAALQKYASKAGEAKGNADACNGIKHLLEVTLPGLVDQSLAEVISGLGRSVIDASNNDATIGAFRREMLDCVEAVSRATVPGSGTN